MYVEKWSLFSESKVIQRTAGAEIWLEDEAHWRLEGNLMEMQQTYVIWKKESSGSDLPLSTEKPAAARCQSGIGNPIFQVNCFSSWEMAYFSCLPCKGNFPSGITGFQQNTLQFLWQTPELRSWVHSAGSSVRMCVLNSVGLDWRSVHLQVLYFFINELSVKLSRIISMKVWWENIKKKKERSQLYFPVISVLNVRHMN